MLGRPHIPRLRPPIQSGPYTPDKPLSSFTVSAPARGCIYYGLPQLRFLPACAGTPRSSRMPWPAPPVHPRAGGEHVTGAASLYGGDGSSPRRRGTPNSRWYTGTLERFIPAQAGNTSPNSLSAWRTPVHPRAGGEHRRALWRAWRVVGSSPRRRGTPPSSCLARTRRRFIPAQAGNTTSPIRRVELISVHPRAGGEHSSYDYDSATDTGSSPRRRGTLCDS